jgi:hypothetical protein
MLSVPVSERCDFENKIQEDGQSPNNNPSHEIYILTSGLPFVCLFALCDVVSDNDLSCQIATVHANHLKLLAK